MATVTLLLGGALTVGAAADMFHSEQYGYSLTIPAGWVQIPDDRIQVAMSSLRSAGIGAGQVYETGFQPGFGQEWFDYPYMLVQVLPYAEFGLDRQLHEDECARLMERMTGLDVNKVIDEKMGQEHRNLLGDARTGMPILDWPNHRFSWTMNMDVAGIGAVHGESVGHFGREAIIQVHFYTRSGDWEKYEPQRAVVTPSFRFDADKAYDPALATAPSGLGAAPLMVKILVGAGVGALVTMLLVAVRVKRIKK